MWRPSGTGIITSLSASIPTTLRPSAQSPNRRESIPPSTWSPVPHDGPTSKGDCLNWIYQRMKDYEARHRMRFRIVVLHDAEDLIHPESLRVINWFSRRYAMVQVPVLPLPTGSANGPTDSIATNSPSISTRTFRFASTWEASFRPTGWARASIGQRWSVSPPRVPAVPSTRHASPRTTKPVTCCTRSAIVRFSFRSGPGRPGPWLRANTSRDACGRPSPNARAG